MEQRFIFYLRTLSSTPYGYTVNIKKLSDFHTVHTCHIAIKDNSITRFKVKQFNFVIHFGVILFLVMVDIHRKFFCEIINIASAFIMPTHSIYVTAHERISCLFNCYYLAVFHRINVGQFFAYKFA